MGGAIVHRPYLLTKKARIPACLFYNEKIVY